MNLPVDIGMKIQKLLEDYMRSDEFDFAMPNLADWVVLASVQDLDDEDGDGVFYLCPAQQMTHRTLGLLYYAEAQLFAG